MSNDTESRSPEQIRDEIEETREDLGATAAALAEKADVKRQAKAKVDEKREQVRAAATHMPETVRERPAPFAAAGVFAGGVLVGWLLGRRRG